ncbi:LysR substrate-binding domain-containing protein [Aliiroseovarius subalbicans]|uniref:LysR substrate-binding domain-containing protein n=1 Tax=Aliiroseovarius subalbicans TaxID=2925840 RepID=UPI001F582C86|nr:LysR substrate-binding domain-containing protein [Aliiroseovarius subalbicans]MCI2400324.1 LysR substrate-binding domain-containing protein [Aliiroseovarius subalbicans]
MTNITIRQLRYFDSLARHGHFGHAAEACAVSQPALSVQIRELEETLGSTLFERMPRRVRLTTLGREFLKRTQEILRAVDELGDLARAAKGQWIGQLRIGVIPTIAPYLLPTIVERLNQSFAGVDIRVRETMTSTLIKELTEGRIDTAILALPISEPSLTEVPLFDENFVLIRPDADRNKPVPDRDMLQEMQLLLLEEGHCFRDQALSFCNIQPNQPRETLDGSSLSTLVQMVGAGLGVTLVPEMAIPVETGAAAVSVARFSEPQPSRTVGMLWRKTSPLAHQYHRIAEIVRNADEARRTSFKAAI